MTIPLSTTTKHTLGVLALLLPLLCPHTALAQTAQEPFGRVRIQYKDFRWQQLSTQNFNVMYYDGGQGSARRAAEYAEKELQRITALIGYYPYSKSTLLFYNSVGDLRQSNIGLTATQQQINGGETPLARMSKVQIAFTGEETEFKRQLSTQITEVLLNDMMYGGSLKEVLQSSYLLQLPDWFISGASAYAAEGWSVDMDGYMRDMTKQYPTGNRTAPFFLRDSKLAGQSIWNYVAERYGYTTIQNILNLTRITRDVEVGISSSLNVPFKVFLKDWLTYYRELNGQPVATLVEPDKKFRQSGRNRHADVFSQPIVSPNGQQVAYAQNEGGRYRVMVMDRDGRHRHTLSRGGYHTPDQQVETRLPVLAWRGNSQVAVAEMSRGEMALHLREADGRGLVRRVREAIKFSRPASLFAAYDQILSMSYSPDGKALAFSAVRNGQNDIYLLRAGSRKVEQLTDDLFDDVQPVFFPGGQALVFSSNRYLDSLGRARPATFQNVVNNYDLFQYHLDGRPVPVETLVSTISNETRPRAISDDEILYLGEESGVRALYRYSLKTKQHAPLTNWLPNTQDFDYSPLTSALVFVAPAQSRDILYVYPEYPLPATLPLTKTARQQTLEERSAVPRAATPKAAAPAATQAAATVAAPAAADTASQPANRRERRKANEAVNTSDYQFEEDEPVQAAPAKRRRLTPTAASTAAAATAKAQAEAPAITGPFRYDTRFMADNVSTSLYMDPLLGLGLQFKAALTDVLENQRIDASLFGLFDLRTSNIRASYTNLTKRYDWGISYQKQAYFFDLDDGRYRYGRHEVAPTIAYPLTHNLSVRGGPRFVTISRTRLGDVSTESDQSYNYLGYNGELVFDNSINTGVNMVSGTRLKASVLNLTNLGDKSLSFGKFVIDLRHYQKISRSIVWANRASYGQFFGSRPQVFRIGGMDDWLNAGYTGNRFLTGYTAPDQVFNQEFVTNLRGFDYSARSGPRYVLFNSELRIPIVQYFAHRPIYSGFFRNLQLVGFADAGTAYSGNNPFGTDNSANTKTTQFNQYFGATVTNFSNPLLVGYGVGARTTLLGFYGKVDVAWGQEDYVTHGPKFYFTLGYDF
ncbi:PD40 domain-containing protein [Microvirga sp. STS02]|uniref:PD40 domain-containing protein n=1 Tax=Hymenobacter negativus TaxID=2795026 RepID=UPI0018DE6AAF|nr:MULTISPECIES: PD40 domain-containing protein [Bacteria]MBH8568188.1 PD40 domain-containing protein [Hymenobacter negativus]MBR7207923.1 PD40 domain-containing protein [Microvirga sp. STS02]